MIEDQYYEEILKKLCKEFSVSIQFYVDENAGFSSGIHYDNFILSKNAKNIGHFPINGKYTIQKQLESSDFQNKLFLLKIKYQEIQFFFDKYLLIADDKLFEEFISRCCIIGKGFKCEENSTKI